MTFWTDKSASRVQNLKSKIVRIYQFYILLYLTIGKKLKMATPMTTENKAMTQKKSVYFGCYF